MIPESTNKTKLKMMSKVIKPVEESNEEDI